MTNNNEVRKPTSELNTTVCNVCHKWCNGYGLDSVNNPVCYECCAEGDKQTMRDTGKITLYLSKTADYEELQQRLGNAKPSGWQVSNWPGSLVIPCMKVNVGRHNIAGKRYDAYFIFEGYIWHGVQYGDNTQLIHCKRTKERYRAPYRIRFVRAELWGNAKDGFDTNNCTNNWWTIGNRSFSQDPSERALLRLARDYFSGYSFAWSENKSSEMKRKGIELQWLSEVPMDGFYEYRYEVQYRGHYVGEIVIEDDLAWESLPDKNKDA